MRATDPVIPQIAPGLSVEPATAALLTTAFTLPYAWCSRCSARLPMCSTKRG